MEKYFYVYILASKKNGTLYIGVTFIIGYSYGSLIRTFRDDDRLVCDCPAVHSSINLALDCEYVIILCELLPIILGMTKNGYFMI